MNFEWIAYRFMFGILGCFLIFLTSVFMEMSIEDELKKYPDLKDGWWLRTRAARKPLLGYIVFFAVISAFVFENDENIYIYHRNLFYLKNSLALCFCFIMPVIVVKIFSYETMVRKKWKS